MLPDTYDLTLNTYSGDSMIKAVIFDLGRVLVDVDLTQGIFRYLNIPTANADLKLMEKLFADSYFQNYVRGKLSPQEFHEIFCRQTGIDLNYEDFKREWCAVFREMKGMDELVGQLSKKYRLGLLSDLGPLHWEYVKNNLPLLKYFTDPLLSFETGCLKPEPRCYLLAAQSVNCSPRDCLFIDDRPVNVDGAKREGMEAVVFESVGALRTILEEKSLL